MDYMTATDNQASGIGRGRSCFFLILSHVSNSMSQVCGEESDKDVPLPRSQGQGKRTPSPVSDPFPFCLKMEVGLVGNAKLRCGN